MGPLGLGLELTLAVENPNGFELGGREVSAKVVLDGKYELGTVTLPNELKLAAGRRSELTVPITVPWTNLPALLPILTQNRSVPYDVDGSLQVGGDTLRAVVPFHLAGVLTREQLQASLPKIPNLPGLQLP